MWQEGAILIPTEEGKTVVHYIAKVYDVGSWYGIEGRRISKRMLKENGRIPYNFDRGEDIPPQNEAAAIALAILMQKYK